VVGKNLFDFANDLTTNILIPLGAMGVAVFTGWFVPKVKYHGSPAVSFLYTLMLRWIVPAVILVIFLESMNVI